MKMMGAVDELGSRGLIDWRRAAVIVLFGKICPVSCVISCGGWRA
jgi:hypothetical protein